jgi:hypothetical protein
LLVCENCSFEIGDDVEETDEVYAVGTTLPLGSEDTADEGMNNRIIVESPTLGEGIDGLFSSRCTGCEQAQ